MECFHVFGAGKLNVYNPTCNNLTNPIGIGSSVSPLLSWKIRSPERNVLQNAYEIWVSANEHALKTGKNLAWNSGKVSSDQSIQVSYKGTQLISNHKYYWKIRVWDNKGNVSDWSEPAYFQMGLLSPDDWKAKWIIPGYNEEANYRPSPLFRKDFSTAKKITSATAYITSHGMYEAYLNGKRIGNALLAPGWTSYNKRLQYQAYDVTQLIQNGNNTIGAMLGNGWYRGVLAWENNGNLYGKDIALLFQLNITYNDGTTEIIKTDESWKCTTGEIVYSQIYNGEIIDARKQKEGWLNNNYNTLEWYNAKEADFPKDKLVATLNEPVIQHEIFKPVKVFTSPAGDRIIDFGQNLVGWVQLKVKGKAGDSIVLSHAEVLDKNGNFYTENLRLAKAQDKYILKGEGEEIFHPHFTWQGFRYVKVEGYNGVIDENNFEAVAIYSNMEPTGTFTTSNALINQLQHNIQWGLKGNFLDIPTDCPQRDERLGWTGDAQVFSKTAAFNMNVDNFFTKWLQDLKADQINGLVPHVIPNILGNSGNSAGWADVATIVPWNMYLIYGDKQILELQYNSMKAYVESIRRVTKNDLWNTGEHFGDWLFYRPFDDNSGESAVTDKHLIAQCFYAYSTQILINTAKVLRKEDDVKEYSNLLDKIKAAFNKEYVTGSGRLVSGTQTAYVLALQFDMLPEQIRSQAAKRLVENIKSYDNHLTTGFLGTPYLCHALTKFGYDSVAYKLLLQETYPSWLYPVKKGATTIWERWDGIKPDGTFQTPTMNSFNHYSYGAIGDWMYQNIAGIQRKEGVPGYKSIVIAPHVGGGFTYANATLKTPYGQIVSSWKIESTIMELKVEIPENTTADIIFPQSTDLSSIKEDGNSLSITSNSYHIGSGQYNFKFSLIH